MSRPIDDAGQEAKTDLTPMIDCVFLLIVFFLCIEFKSLESKLTAYLPTEKGARSEIIEPQEQMTMRIELVDMGHKVPRVLGQPEIDPNTHRPNAVAWLDHKVRYFVGPTPFADLEHVRLELVKIKDDPESIVAVARHPGQRKLLPVVIEPQPGTTYGDVASAVDAVRSAGFEEINFGGGRGATKH